MAYKTAQKDEATGCCTAPMEEYTRANAIKPDNEGVLMQLARADSALGDYAKAEAALPSGASQRTRRCRTAYTELYGSNVPARSWPKAKQVLKSGFQNNPKQFGFLTTAGDALLAHGPARRHDRRCCNR